jgi:hypothetical protein
MVPKGTAPDESAEMRNRFNKNITMKMKLEIIIISEETSQRAWKSDVGTSVAVKNKFLR